MTRTAVRRRVDVSDGRLVIRKIVVETSECLSPGPAEEPIVAIAAPADESAEPARSKRKAGKPRSLRPGKYAVRIRKLHLL